MGLLIAIGLILAVIAACAACGSPEKRPAGSTELVPAQPAAAPAEKERPRRTWGLPPPDELPLDVIPRFVPCTSEQVDRFLGQERITRTYANWRLLQKDRVNMELVGYTTDSVGYGCQARYSGAPRLNPKAAFYYDQRTDELVRLYFSNHLAGERAYQDQVVEIRAHFTSVDSTTGATPYAVLGYCPPLTGKEYMQAQGMEHRFDVGVFNCALPDSALLTLRKDQWVSLRGTMRYAYRAAGYYPVITMTLEDCTIIGICDQADLRPQL